MQRELPISFAGLVCALALAAPAAAADLEIVTRTSITVPMDSNGSSSPAHRVSADGRYALYLSDASNLVAGDTNRATDVFLYDSQSDTSTRVSLASGGVQANGPSALQADMSADARFIVFEAAASNLAAGATANSWQIYLHDRTTQTTQMVSRAADGSVGWTGSFGPRISADGNTVVFATYDNLVEADYNFANDVYRYDRSSGALSLVSVSASGEIGDMDSDHPQISADGRYVVFHSQASNLVPGDTNFGRDIVLRDLLTGVNVLAGIAPGGGQFSGQRDLAYGNAISADGRYVLFNTDTSVQLDDTNSSVDGFRFDRVTGQAIRVTSGPTGAVLAYGATASALSSDGNALVMESVSNDVVPGLSQLRGRSYLRDIGSGATSLIKIRPGAVVDTDESYSCNLSGTATVWCAADGSALAADDGNDFTDLFRVATGADGGVRVSHPLQPSAVAAANHNSGRFTGGVSADGRFVVFDSRASNLVPGDNNGISDVFLRDRLNGTTQRISMTSAGAESTCYSSSPAITPDGRYVVFYSCGGLAAPASVGLDQVYRYDRISGEILLASRGAGGAPCNNYCRDASISASGDAIVFRSRATNLSAGPLPASGDGVFLRNLAGATTQLINRGLQGAAANGGAGKAKISGDGRYVYFDDTSSNLVPGDVNGVSDVFAFDRIGTTLNRVSLGNAGLPLDWASYFAAVSHDGSDLVFRNAGFLCSGHGMHVRNRASGLSACVSSVAPGPVTGEADISADGSRIAFEALDMAGTSRTIPRVRAILLYERTTQQTHRVTPVGANGDARLQQICPDGRCLVLASTANNLVAEDANNHFSDIFLAADLTGEGIFADGFHAQP